MDKQHEKEEAQSGEKTEPESGTALTSERIKGQKDSLSRDYLFIDGGKRCIAFKTGVDCYMRPDLSKIEKKQAWSWFFLLFLPAFLCFTAL